MLNKYIFRIYTEEDPDDGESVWEEAETKEEATRRVLDDYHSITKIVLMSVEKGKPDPKPEPVEDPYVYTSKSRKTYHKAKWCTYLRDRDVIKIRLSEAIKSGMKECKRCSSGKYLKE